MQEAIGVYIKIGWSYWFSLRCFTVSQCRQTQQDGFNQQTKTAIENDFNEKGWNANKIWKEHPNFECSRMAVYHLIKKIKETGSKERLKGKGRPVTAITEENASIFEELLCSQEDEPGTHNSIRQIALRISKIVTKIAWLQSFRLLLLGLRSRGPCYPFGTIDELKRIIRDAWDECATDLSQIRKTMKQFLPRLEAVDAKEGGSIKTFFG